MSAPNLYFLDQYMANRSLMSPGGYDRATVEATVEKAIGPVRDIRPLGRGLNHQTLSVDLVDDTEIVARVFTPSTSTLKIESEVATMQYIRKRCMSIPVPEVFYHDEHMLLMEKVPGVQLQTIYNDLSLYDKHEIVKQIATWMVELFNHRFEQTGSLYCRDGSEDFFVGPMVADPFCGGARGQMELDRGPWSSARDYFFSCAQRELDLSRSLQGNETSHSYRAMLETQRDAVERSMQLMIEIVIRCKCLDEDDPELAPFAIDLDDFGPSNLFVDPDEPSNIVGVVGWQGICTRPLWLCAHMPRWISPSLSSAPSDPQHEEAVHLSNLFRRTVAKLDRHFLRALDCDDIRKALEGVVRFDAVQDGFLLLPTVESLAATLPGEEDVDGLQSLLDPDTLAGRAARISIVTKGGSQALALADRRPRLVPAVGRDRSRSISQTNALNLELV